MPSEIYVDVPSDYPYKFGKYESGPQVLTRDFGVTFTFICNRAANLSGDEAHGDIHRIEFDSEAEELLFLLRTPFKLLNKDVVENYINIKRIKQNEANHRSPSRRRR
jgi:hypothetical protein